MNKPPKKPRKKHVRVPVPASCTFEKSADGKRITLVIPLPTPSLNEFNHAHWRKENSLKDQWHTMLRVIIGRHALTLKALGKRRYRIERHGAQALDFDNLIGGAKCVLTDNLRKLGLLLDDNCKSVIFEADNVPLPAGVAAHTVVTLEDVV